MNKYEIVTPNCRYDVEADFFISLDPSKPVAYFYRGTGEAKELVGVVNLPNVISVHLAELSPGDEDDEEEVDENAGDTFGKLG